MLLDNVIQVLFNVPRILALVIPVPMMFDSSVTDVEYVLPVDSSMIGRDLYKVGRIILAAKSNPAWVARKTEFTPKAGPERIHGGQCLELYWCAIQLQDVVKEAQAIVDYDDPTDQDDRDGMSTPRPIETRKGEAVRHVDDAIPASRREELMETLAKEGPRWKGGLFRHGCTATLESALLAYMKFAWANSDEASDMQCILLWDRTMGHMDQTSLEVRQFRQTVSEHVSKWQQANAVSNLEAKCRAFQASPALEFVSGVLTAFQAAEACPEEIGLEVIAVATAALEETLTLATVGDIVAATNGSKYLLQLLSFCSASTSPFVTKAVGSLKKVLKLWQTTASNLQGTVALVNAPQVGDTAATTVDSLVTSIVNTQDALKPATTPGSETWTTFAKAGLDWLAATATPHLSVFSDTVVTKAVDELERAVAKLQSVNGGAAGGGHWTASWDPSTKTLPQHFAATLDTVEIAAIVGQMDTVQKAAMQTDRQPASGQM